MKLTEPRAMAEIHEIRLRIQAERERLGNQEYDRIARQRTMAMLEKYGLKLRFVTPEQVRNTVGGMELVTHDFTNHQKPEFQAHD
jgi:hypothetical protein